MSLKKCSKCRKRLNRRDFNKDKHRKEGLQRYCRGCNTNSLLQRRYKITFLERHQMSQWQGHKCAICRVKEDKIRLSVDHNHTTGQIGMLLCRKCNSGNNCADDIIITAAYLEYLKTYHA